jgi:poly-gamma-glutamate synthesis protein (capsule biosynthesis protein)
LIAAELLASALVLHWVLVPRNADQAPGATATPGAVQSPVRRIQVAADAPPAVARAIDAWTVRQSAGWTRVESGRADLVVGWRKRRGSVPLADVVLVPAVPFASLRQDVALEALRRAWRGGSQQSDEPLQLLVSPRTATALDALLGSRDSTAPVDIVSEQELMGRLEAEPAALAIVPFDGLEPRLQPLAVDGLSALDRSLDLDRYPLRARLWASGDVEGAGDLAAFLQAQSAATNRDPQRLTVLLMTGVTALTRGVAVEMEARGDGAWPARAVADLLSSADLTHVSNEVSFMPGCQAQRQTTSFCASPSYLETLHLAGVDLVELTGNHNLDYGPRFALYSLDLYAEAGMQTFGGGRDAGEAQEPLLVAHNGNRLAFLGYNAFGPAYAWASEERPGAARFSPEGARATMAALRAQADVILVSVQYTETYRTRPLPRQVADFRALAEAGADVVTGSQAHQPQAIEIYQGKLIFYGLGNLFFDQTWSEATRQGLVVRHVIYDGRLIASQVIPTMIDGNCQTHVAAGQERETILRAVVREIGR